MISISKSMSGTSYNKAPVRTFALTIENLEITGPVENQKGFYYDVRVELENELYPVEFRVFINEDESGNISGTGFKLVELFEACNVQPPGNHEDPTAYTDVNGAVYPEVLINCIGKTVCIAKYVYKLNEAGNPSYRPHDRFGANEKQVLSRFNKDVEKGYVWSYQPDLVVPEDEITLPNDSQDAPF